MSMDDLKKWISHLEDENRKLRKESIPIEWIEEKLEYFEENDNKEKFEVYWEVLDQWRWENEFIQKEEQ